MVSLAGEKGRKLMNEAVRKAGSIAKVGKYMKLLSFNLKMILLKYYLMLQLSDVKKKMKTNEIS